MILRPLGANIVLRVMEAPTKNGGIFLPESKREETMQRPVGEVIAVGPDVNEPGTGDEISVGDVLVFWKPNAGYVYGLDGKMNLLVKRADVIAFVESDATATPEELERISECTEALSVTP